MGHADPVTEHRLTVKTATAPFVGAPHAETAVWSYNGTVPGPEIRVRQGSRLRVVVENQLAEETTVHWHGLRVPNAMDGVPHLTQRPIAPGETFTYEFDLPDAGTYWYHLVTAMIVQLFRPAAVAALLAMGLLAFGVIARTVWAGEAPAGFAMHDEPRAVQEITFVDREGRDLSLTDFGGKVVLLNIWATWCAPCRHEMPTLDRLQAELAGPDFEVVALSIDRKGTSAVTAFYEEIGLEALQIYVDQSGAAQRALHVLGIPTTLLLDRDGQELGRLAGPAEWDSPEMVDFLRGLIDRTTGAGHDDRLLPERFAAPTSIDVSEQHASTPNRSPFPRRKLEIPSGDST